VEKPMKNIDSHLHVWAGDSGKYPYWLGAGEPAARGDAEFLIELQEESGIFGALIVQSKFHGFDHRYVTDTLRQWPDRFIGMALANPAASQPVADLRRLVEEDGYRGVRLNPALWPEGEAMDGPIGDALMSYCEEVGIVAGFLIQPRHFSEVGALCSRHPGASVIIDHFGRVKPGEAGQADVDALVSLSEHPNTYVKVSGFPVSSEQDWPYRDMNPIVRRLIGSYGVERLMFATDFPHIVAQCGYARGWQIVDELEPSLSDRERKWLFGGTVSRLFNHWGDQ
jgi:predicted TIM-barrel fold metal-dependent hydrolase